MSRIAYKVFLVILFLAFYIVPYTVLSSSKGLELFVFWAILTLAIGLISFYELWWRR